MANANDHRGIRRAVVSVAAAAALVSAHVAVDATASGRRPTAGDAVVARTQPPTAGAGRVAAAPASAGAAAYLDGSTGTGATLSVAAPSATSDIAAATEPRVLCGDDIVSGLYLTVFNMKDLANTVVTYEVSSSTTGVVGFSSSPEGPFTPTLEVLVPLDANGNGTSDHFALKALEVGHTVVTACSDAPGLGCILNPRATVVMGLTEIEFSAVDSPLDDNPGPGGGLRIYPDRQTANDAVDRRLVRVKAVATEALGGLTVHFKSFDVDDPSSDSRPVDANGPEGNDNFGVGAALIGTAQTDANGIAEQTLIVSTQPGDNFKVAAGCSLSYLDGLQTDGVDVVDADGQALPTTRAEVTDLLTVWRKLHVEMDSMGLVTGNEVTGTIAAADSNVFDPTSDLKLQLAPPDERLERHQFTNGRITIAGLGTFTVVGNTGTGVEVYALLGEEAVGRSFVLVDDDDFNGNDLATPDGDANENVFAPSIAFIEDGADGVCDGSAQNLYAVAYVCPVFDVGDNNDFVPFVLNVPHTIEDKIASYDFDAVDTEADAGYWTVYLLGAYQGSESRDLDNETGGMAGAVDDINGLGASIYLETLADDVRNRGLIAPCSTAATVAHEIAHLFGSTHSHGGLMESPCDKAVTMLSDKTIVTIRKAVHP